MKNILFVTLLILAAISLTLVGCGPSSTSATTTPAPATTTAPTTSVPKTTAPATTTAPTTPAAKVITWKVATYITPQMTPSYTILKWWSDEVAKQTNGRLVMKIYDSESLVTQSGQLEALQSGLCDMAQIQPGAFPTKLPLTNIIGLPALGPTRADQWNVAFNQLVSTDPDFSTEFNQWNVVYGFAVHSAIKDIGGRVPIRTVADLNGKKVRVSSAAEGTVIKQFGATPITIPIGDVYTSLSSGLIDLALQGEVDYYTLKWYEVSKYFMENVASSKAGSVYLFNKDSWNALPKDIQDIVNGIDQKQIPVQDYYLWHTPELVKATQDAFAKVGLQVIQFPPEERAKLLAAGPQAWADWISKSGGDKAQKALDTLQAAFKDVLAKYPNGVQ